MRRLSTVALAATISAGCAAIGGSDGPRAVAKLEPTRGNAASGTVTFVQRGDKVLVNLQVSGLKPGVEHGFHVHEKGDCSSGDGMSAGGHFNPLGSLHGRHGAGMHHVGDLPSLIADSNGGASATFESSTIAVGRGANDVVGKGLMVHRDPDDYKTQPTGNAGPRLACAVIRLDRR